MLRKFTKQLLIGAVLTFTSSILFAQNEVSQEGEFGFGIGGAHYFGDLNNNSKINRAKPAATLFFRKNLGNYIAARLSMNFAQVGYSDKYNTYNKVFQNRNLSFNSNIWEFTLQGDFNFFRFMPGEPGFSFTPYITLGVGAFNYDPYTYLAGNKYYFRQLQVGTEGQNSPLYPDRKMYGTTAISIPFGGGFKYAVNSRFNIALELCHRFTTTDYLDDVSKTYVDPNAFPTGVGGGPSISQLLSDRSYELGPTIGVPGKQRGTSKQKDQFITGMLLISFNLQSYHCPSYH
jgi:hypothetical protein